MFIVKQKRHPVSEPVRQEVANWISICQWNNLEDSRTFTDGTAAYTIHFKPAKPYQLNKPSYRPEVAKRLGLAWQGTQPQTWWHTLEGGTVDEEGIVYLYPDCPIEPDPVRQFKMLDPQPLRIEIDLQAAMPWVQLVKDVAFNSSGLAYEGYRKLCKKCEEVVFLSPSQQMGMFI